MNSFEERLARCLFSKIQASDDGVFYQTDYAKKVAKGVVHCERHGLKWRDAALSLRHIADGESLSSVITLPKEEVGSSNKIFEKLRLPLGAEPLDYGLPIENAQFTLQAKERQRTLAFFWIHAAIFAKSEGFETYRHVMTQPSVF